MEGKSVSQPTSEGVDPYALPRKQGILKTVYYKTKLSSKFESVNVLYTMTCFSLLLVYDYINRIEDQRDRFETRFAKKMEKEKEFYNTKYHL